MNDVDQIVTAVQVVPGRRQGLWWEWGYHFSILVLAVGVLWLSFAMRLEGLHSVFLPGSVIPLPESCLSLLWFGFECPGCGLTRSFICCSRGDWEASIQFNFAGPWMYLLVWIQVPWQSWQLTKLCRGREPFFSTWLFAFPALVLLMLMAQWLMR